MTEKSKPPKPLFVYIAGPYALGDTAMNIRAAIFAADDVMNLGHWPYCPHLTHFQHLVGPRITSDWLHLDTAWLGKCDILIRLHGKSLGADAEVETAQLLGIPVYHGIEAFVAAYGKDYGNE